MTRVFTANLFITTSRYAIEQIFFSKNKVKSFKSRLNTLSDEDLKNSFIMSPNSNDEVLSFSHTMAQEGQNRAVMELEMLETSKLLELSLLDNDPMLSMLSERLDEHERTKRGLGDRANPFDKLTANEKLGAKKVFYVAYGSGDDVTTWSGPFITKLAIARLSNREANERVILLTLVPSDSLKSWSSKFKKVGGYNAALAGLGEALSRKDVIRARGELSITSQDPGWQLPDLDYIYRYVIRDYIGSYTGNSGNVIIASPYKLGFGSIAPNRVGRTRQLLFDLTEGGSNQLGAIRASNSGIRHSNIELVDSTTQPSPTDVTDYRSKNQSSPGPILGFDQSFTARPEDIQLDLTKTPDENLAILSQYTLDADHDLVNELMQKQAKRIYDEGLLPAGTVGITFSVEVNNERASHEESDWTPLTEPLVKWAAGMKQGGDKGYKGSFDYFDESDIRILKLWKKYGFIVSDETPAHIFGDTDFIRKVLYPDGKEKDITNEEYYTLPYMLQMEDLKQDMGLTVPEYQQSVASEKYKDYEREFREVLGLDTKQTVASDFEVMEDLDSLNISKTVKEDLAGTDVLFKHSVRNPNVISLNYSVDHYLATLVNLDIRPDLDKRALGSTRLELTKQAANELISNEMAERLIALIPEDNRTSIVGSVDQLLLNQPTTLKFAQALSEAPDLLESIANKEAVDIVGMIYFLHNFDRIKENNNKVSLITEANKVAGTAAAIYDLTSKYLVRADITTLPFFNRGATLHKNASLVGITGGVIGGAQTNRSLAPYTGRYRIVGFKHVISPDDIHSEFNLVRENIASTAALSKATVKDVLCKTLSDEAQRLVKEGEEAVLAEAREEDGVQSAQLEQGRAQKKVKAINTILKRLGCRSDYRVRSLAEQAGLK